jgi:hypothetical protein
MQNSCHGKYFSFCLEDIADTRTKHKRCEWCNGIDSNVIAGILKVEPDSVKPDLSDQGSSKANSICISSGHIPRPSWRKKPSLAKCLSPFFTRRHERATDEMHKKTTQSSNIHGDSRKQS